MCSGERGDGEPRHDHEAVPSPGAFMANLRKPMPASRKLALVTRNTSRKVIRLASCCGRPGEPGC